MKAFGIILIVLTPFLSLVVWLHECFMALFKVLIEAYRLVRLG